MIGLVRIVAGAVFVLACVGKLVDHESPRTVPLLLGEASAWRGPAEAVERALPALEGIVGGGLILAVGVRAACALGIGLSLLFIGAAVALQERGLTCRCFGAFGGFSRADAHLAVAVGLLLACTISLFGERMQRRRLR